MQSIRIFDAHCDTISELLDNNQPLYENTMQFSLKKTEGYAHYAQVFAAWIDTQKYPGRFARACAIINKLKAEIAANPTRICFADSAESVRRAWAEGKAAALLSVEDGAALEGNIDNLYRLYEQGVRFLTLTWNGRNELCDGIGVENGGGLTPFGRQVVREMERIGMAVDVSHISVRGFYDVMGLATRPVCATHSNSKAICPHRRNLTDEQIRLIAQSGGVAGVTVYDAFVGGSTAEDIYHHIAHWLELGLENSIGIGTDFDGMSSPALRDVSELGTLVQMMHREGLSTQTIEAITHGNWMQYLSTFS